MSDKFFFKGRQDARLNHADQSFQTNASHKIGSKKYPLDLLVTSEKRKQEIEALVSENTLFANVTVDLTENAVESIAALNALLNTEKTVTIEKTPNRNDPCSCGSGKKFKKCCG